MGFMDFLKTGKRDKFELKKPLADPLASPSGQVASLPNFEGSGTSFDSFRDSSLNPDLGTPRTPSLDTQPMSQKEQKFMMPEFQEQEAKNAGYSSPYPGRYSQQQSSSSSSAPSIEKDIQLISSKLDYLKAMLENLSHRLEALERIAKGEEEEVKW